MSTRKEVAQLIERLTKKRLSLYHSKSADYATTDALSNFKRVSSIVGLLRIDASTPGGYARLMVVLKLDRWCNLLAEGKDPQNESVEDTILDLHNYIDLGYACDLKAQ